MLVRVRASSRVLSAPVRLVVSARAVEPEPVLANNLDRERVRVSRVPAQACSAATPVARASC